MQKRKTVYINMPEESEVAKIVLIERPDTIFINLACKGNGIIKIIPNSDKKVAPTIA